MCEMISLSLSLVAATKDEVLLKHGWHRPHPIQMGISAHPSSRKAAVHVNLTFWRVAKVPAFPSSHIL